MSSSLSALRSAHVQRRSIKGGGDGFKPAPSSLQYRARGRISFRDVGKTCEVSWICQLSRK
jgi:hypothetical protein